ncbi:uncharacterized protein LOC114578444 [Dendrobium catenatum]|uniref:Uncharacterized protein n=1 Tax=Dendrobium catenatum TaxID=906689 RepID=A0A2I0VGS7_9ASPA|nr:uncharacterized protein LOC114578444 [Dendrobium catenatum]PKU62603.1 hypothetical protein MA16_Dca028497 [Dendrobium catenatum]
MDFSRTDQTLLCFLFISSPLLFAFADNHQSYNSLTAYEMLEKFDFPKGILPEGVQSYLLRSDGSFDVFLGDYCELKASGSYLLRYRRKISGKVEPRSLKKLDGVSVKIFFLWFGISEVIRSGDELRFFVGPFSSSFSISNFEFCPQCRDKFSSLDQLVQNS